MTDWIDKDSGRKRKGILYVGTRDSWRNGNRQPGRYDGVWGQHDGDLITGQTCDGQTFKEMLPTERDVPVATAATAYNDPKTRETVILGFTKGYGFDLL